MKTSQAIIDALERFKTLDPTFRPKRVTLGPDDYSRLHGEAEDAELHAYPRNPETEDERLEFCGMKVYCHSSSRIEFE